MFSLRLKELREAAGYRSQQAFADAFGVVQSTVGNWEAGSRMPSHELTKRLAEFFGVTVDYLLYGVKSEVPRAASSTLIPVVGTVAAGLPVIAEDDILDYEEVTPETAARGELFGLRVKGSSMEPRIMEGDVVIVRRQSTAVTGDTVVCKINGDEATVKKIKIRPDGWTLLPTNPAFDPLIFTCDEIATLPVTIIGKVIELRGKF